MQIRINPLASGLVLAALVAGTAAAPAAGSAVAAGPSQPAASVFGDPDDGGQLHARLVSYSDPDSGGQLN